MRCSIAVAFSCSWAVAAFAPAHGAVLAVTSNAGSGPGTLRAAIEAVNAGAPGDQHDIVFHLSQADATVWAETPLPTIDKPFVRLVGRPNDGPWARPVLSVSNSAGGPVLAFGPSTVDAELHDLVVRNNGALHRCIDAGSLTTNAQLLLANMRIEECALYALDGDPTPLRGGGLFANGQVSIVDSEFVNTLVQGADATVRVEGGAVALQSGSLYLQGSHFQGAVRTARRPSPRAEAARYGSNTAR